MVREILGRVSACVLWAIIVTVEYQAGGSKFEFLHIPATTHTFVGTALGLLLVFRMNSSYDRFWEGRKLWGGIVNESRNLVRRASVFLAADPELVREVTLWTAAFSYASMARLRGKRNCGSLEASLPTADMQEVLKADHIPLAVARRITALLERARERGLIDSYRLGLLDENTQALIDYLGGCERIRATPMPYAYAIHLRRALLFFFFTLPFVLVPDFHWSTIPAVFLSCYVFFGIEEIGVEIENPFGEGVNDLPLETICSSIEATLRDTLPHISRESPSSH